MKYNRRILELIALYGLWATNAIEVLGQSLSQGLTPQMGWDSFVLCMRKKTKRTVLADTCRNRWNAYGADYNISVIEQTVQLFEELGLKAAGYQYTNLDDGWSALTRTPDGYLQANSTTFPDGMKALADYVHMYGLKLGLYGDSGMMTCEFRPGSWGYEKRDALTLASWEVDYWKYDNCGGFAAMVDSPEVRFGGK
jgi:hypothetical protein